MAIKNKGSNQLLLLAGTAFVLCVAVLSNGKNSVSDSLQGMVLSDRDEVRETKEVEEKNKETKENNEKVKEDEKKRTELRTEELKNKTERSREEEKKRSEIKIREKKSTIESKNEDEELNNQKKEDDNEVKKEFEIETDGIKATTDLELKLNKRTNELNAKTKDGKSVEVQVLPNQAVENLSLNKDIEEVNETELVENESTGKFEYKAKVIERKKIFGLFDIKINKEYRVSSEDGNVTEVELSGLNKILNLISF